MAGEHWGRPVVGGPPRHRPRPPRPPRRSATRACTTISCLVPLPARAGPRRPRCALRPLPPLAFFPVLVGELDLPAAALSGGQQQMLGPGPLARWPDRASCSSHASPPWVWRRLLVREDLLGHWSPARAGGDHPSWSSRWLPKRWPSPTSWPCPTFLERGRHRPALEGTGLALRRSHRGDRGVILSPVRPARWPTLKASPAATIILPAMSLLLLHRAPGQRIAPSAARRKGRRAGSRPHSVFYSRDQCSLA